MSDVATHGWHVINVLPELDSPAFSYSIGMFATLEHPEVIIIGLSSSSAHGIINGLGDQVREGKRFAAGNVYDDLLEGYKATFRVVPAAQFRNYLGYARWYYEGDDFAALQLVYPDSQGRWPWDPAATADFRQSQPVIVDEGDPPWLDKEKRSRNPQ